MNSRLRQQGVASCRRLQLFEVFAQLCQHSPESLSLAHTHSDTHAGTHGVCREVPCGWGLRTHICSPLVFVIIVITPYLNCSRSKLALPLPLSLPLLLPHSVGPKCSCHTEISQTLNARQMHFVLDNERTARMDGLLAKLKESRSTLGLFAYSP